MNDREIAGVKVFVSGETYDEYKGTLQEQIENLQSKIDKAIKYIETNKHFEWHTIRNEKGKLDTAKIATDWVSGNEILDILKEDK